MISRALSEKLQSGSMIRKMFEEGMRLKSIFGADKVFDFSLGNPDLDLPAEVADALRRLSMDHTSATHGYMSNSGYPSTRAAVAKKLSRQSGLDIPASSVVMTSGAAGGLNVVFKTLLDPDDEVLILAPYFMEYLSYVDNHRGRPVIVQTTADSFLPDLDAIRAAITSKTKAIILNTPNNPTGTIYDEPTLRELNSLLLSVGHVVYVVSDEPYNEIVYDGATVPSTLALFDNAVVCNSWSKSLSLAGERVGYVAVRPSADDYARLMDGLVLANRILGFVNAPSLMQKVVEAAIDARVDIATYQARRDALHGILERAGFDCRKPAGALYLFSRSPMPDDRALAAAAASHNILCVPGSAFGRPGYFRLAFCVGMEVIVRSETAFQALGKELRLTGK
jgi:aspartate aminotransferase